MRILTTTEYNEVCKSYEQFGSKLYDEMFLGYDDNREKFELNLCDKYNTICYSDELIWDVEHLGYTAICEEAYNELTVN